jgi:hypothetical protein
VMPTTTVDQGSSSLPGFGSLGRDSQWLATGWKQSRSYNMLVSFTFILDSKSTGLRGSIHMCNIVTWRKLHSSD